MIGRMVAKAKISVTVSAELLGWIDRAARQDGSTRSATIEAWLRASAGRVVAQAVDDATAAYYASLRGDDVARADGEAIARATSDAARRVTYDARPKAASQKRPTGRGRRA
jgi:hypothetical protein